MAERIGTTLDKAANKAVELGLWGIIGLVHGARSVYDTLPSSETVSNTVQSLGNKIRKAQSSPTSIAHTDSDWELIDTFKAPDVISESSDVSGIELLEAGLLYPSKQQVPIYDIETGFGGSSMSSDNKSVITPIPFDAAKSMNMYYDGGIWKYACGPTFEATLDGDTLLDEQ